MFKKKNETVRVTEEKEKDEIRRIYGIEKKVTIRNTEYHVELMFQLKNIS